MVCTKALLTLCVGALLQALPVYSRVDKRGNVCTVVPEGNGRDDSPSIISAFAQCKKDASVVFLNRTYHVERVMSTHGLRNVTVDVKGTLLWGTNTTYWINNSLPLGYQNQSVAWDFGGDNIFWTGHGYGTFDGNGQIWYDLANGASNMFGRPINLVIRNTTNFTMQDMRFVQSQFWTMAVHTAENLLLERITIRSVSNSSASTLNTDGIDTFYTNNITLRNWDVTEGDDAVAPKANTSNLLIQDSHFRDGSGVAIGSIGQYPGMYEFIENVTAERIVCDRCRHAGYVKTWTGVQKGVPPNGGGGGVGYVKNIVFRDFNVTNITDSVAQITQCTSFEGQTGDCDTSTFQISNVTWSNISGTVSNNLLATLQCSGAAPCPDIVVEGVDGLVFNSASARPDVECSHVTLGPGSVACNGNATRV
ncbi:glycoside hydrolase family 28 protein [Polyporus arcularius HHB13444]|uniref:Glycoside hydrolase family 28 protein n=1 Tax=Polyporus arcularius HHB13444 TaxID=1314778 RepID=A0A5C3PUD1_9APHY|nr:glycoside hydrolase family 28 protein [Polyporus arcularius HHB13444]